MDNFKDLLKAMHPLSRNMHIRFQFRKFTDFQKPLCEFQGKKSYLRDRCDWSRLPGGEKVFAERERLRMSSVYRIVGGREFSRGRVISLPPVALHALHSHKSE